jgi:protein SCO1/2
MSRARLALLYFAVFPLLALAGDMGHELHSRPDLRGYETKIIVPQITLLDSKGRQQELPHLMHERIVILNFVFTSCSTICPMLSATMRDMEERLSDRVGKEAVLISISVDPANDNPERLRVYANKIGSGPNWHWLTGTPLDVEYALRAFGVPTGGRPENHPPTILVGNTLTGRWLRWVGMTSPERLIDAVDAVTDDSSNSNKRSHAQQR